MAVDDRRFEAALSAWGAGFRMVEWLGGGNRNEMRLVTGDGERFAARLSPRPRAALTWELRLLEHLHANGLRVPRSLPAADGRRIVDGLVLFEWLDGDPPSSTAEWQRLSETLSHVHSITRGWPQRPGFRSTQDLLSADAGGDARLDLMPPEAVARCRTAWRALASEPVSVVHGDPGAGNVRISRAGVGLIDWDEARVDASILDIASLPSVATPGYGRNRLAHARRALDAWEAANGWVVEPAYARRRLARLA